MKLKTQIETLKSIRKSPLPQNQVERPMKGAGYRRPRNVKWDQIED